MSEHGIPTGAEVIAQHRWDGDYFTCSCMEPDEPDSECDEIYYVEWAEHVSAALREARTITTVEALDALPVWTVVRETALAGCIWTKTTNDWAFGGMASDGFASGAMCLPARVLYLPGEDKE